VQTIYGNAARASSPAKMLPPRCPSSADKHCIYNLVAAALARLAEQGTVLCYTHQNIAELWNTMTRPAERNGLGLSVAEAEREVLAIEAGMSLLPENEHVYREWGQIVRPCTFTASSISLH